jgi:NitT/TauT family transport system permease protein
MVFTSDNSNQKKAAEGLSKTRKTIFIATGIFAMLIVWQILSMIFSEFIIASPAATLVALGSLIANGTLWSEFGYSLGRLVIGLAAGWVIGVSLGILAGLNKRLRAFLEPMRWAVMTVPAIIISVLAMLWFGMGSIQVIFMTGIITMPVSYVSTLEGMLAIDVRITEMASVYKIPSSLKLREIYFPGIGSAVMSGLTLASGIGVRATILAEFIGARNGIGHNLFLSWTFLDTPALFAWILAAFALLGLVEFGILKPIRDHLMRWKKAV